MPSGSQPTSTTAEAPQAPIISWPSAPMFQSRMRKATEQARPGEDEGRGLDQRVREDAHAAERGPQDVGVGADGVAADEPDEQRRDEQGDDDGRDGGDDAEAPGRLEASLGVDGEGHQVAAAFKPRTSPYSFQGLGMDGVRFLVEARERTGLPIVTEVMEPSQVEVVALHADILQVGARNMQNYSLLMAVGRTERPVLLKRGLSATIEEWLMAAEYIVSSGNPNVILCERGIRTFETYTRNTLDLAAVPLLHRLTHLPVIVDPSHATGKRWLVPPMALAAVAGGADGIMVEVHPDPGRRPVRWRAVADARAVRAIWRRCCARSTARS